MSLAGFTAAFVWAGLVLGVFGGFGPWRPWSECNSTCAVTGIQTRFRVCDAAPCDGVKREWKTCNQDFGQCPNNPNECNDVMNTPGFDHDCSNLIVKFQGQEICRGVMITKTFALIDVACIPAGSNLTQYTMVTLCDPNTEYSLAYQDVMDQGLSVLRIIKHGFFPGVGVPPTFDELWHRLVRTTSELARLNYQDPQLFNNFCVPGFNRGSSWVEQGNCNLMESSKEICMQLSGGNFDFDDTMIGTPVYAEAAGQVWLIGTIRRKIPGTNFFVVKSVEVIHDDIGCSKISGIWSDWQNKHTPTKIDCECENWWNNEVPICGKASPVCVDYRMANTFEGATEMANVATCPTEQKVSSSVKNGFQCKYEDNFDDFFNRCYCNDYEVRFKCPFPLKLE